jgi:hypothetical protein
MGMYAPDALNSFASVGSTRVILPVTFLALSRGTNAPHWLQLTVPELPLPPFDLPLLALFFGIYWVRPVCYPLNLVLKIGYWSSFADPTSRNLRKNVSLSSVKVILYRNHDDPLMHL